VIPNETEKEKLHPLALRLAAVFDADGGRSKALEWAFDSVPADGEGVETGDHLYATLQYGVSATEDRSMVHDAAGLVRQAVLE
jgi:hypothetical protein